MIIYNEIEPFALEWLGRLVHAGHLPTPALIDPRSITDLEPDDVRDATQFHTFAGIGVWSRALELAGVPADFPVWTGSCPCQPFSLIGERRGEEDERHLFPVWRDLIAECRPAVIFGEQVAGPPGRQWLADVSADLETLGYRVGSADLCAAGVGAPHIRARHYFGAVLDRGMGDAFRARLEGYARDVDARAESRRELEEAHRPATPTGYPGEPSRRDTAGFWAPADWFQCTDGKWRPAQPGSCPVADGTPTHVGRLRAYGNAIVAPLAAAFVEEFLSACASAEFTL